MKAYIARGNATQLSYRKFVIVTVVAIVMLCVLAFFASLLPISDTQRNLNELLAYANDVSAITDKYDANSSYTKNLTFEDGDISWINNTAMLDIYAFIDKTGFIVSFPSMGIAQIFSNDMSVIVSAYSNSLNTSDGRIINSVIAPQFSYALGTVSVLLPLEATASAFGFVAEQSEQAFVLSKPFQTKRLIVRATGSIDSYGAIEGASGFEDYYIFQYSTVDAAQTAYLKLLTSKYVLSVEPDLVLFLDSNETYLDSSTSETGEDCSDTYSTDAPISTYATAGSNSYRSWGASNSIMGFLDYNKSLNS
ncbi:MAG: hypothetical protein LBE09_00575, partial [Christensenellaceae bacterium]|nr:hypothetical protein [Christensenellaceae bacterium]